ncbi:MAG: endonuclease Q family protein [Candidatus Cohnella colombiensis]|uniref:Endonuclease Q family protein n=1 Tax=Candidatus Cohnella colombiensis TaxID=3121368 RepID=A0AA95F0K4_9BACL|nr:MAG: endonuclease Q family protein [Cohnella sp.]
MSVEQAPDKLNRYFADLHVHIGRSQSGQPVKISASKSLTFRSIAHEAAKRKGIAMIGIVDSHSPEVQADMIACLDNGEMEEIAGGGIRYQGTTLLLGVEMEVRDEGGGPYHLLGFLPNLQAMQQWTEWMKSCVTNIHLSSQRLRVSGLELQQELLARGGILIPAHIFTPHRGLLGCSSDRLDHRLKADGIAAIELGLSADTDMAGRISELNRYAFLSNSDAHSAQMIGRECNEFKCAVPSFVELVQTLSGTNGREIVTNYGLHPLLGKYHSTACLNCKTVIAIGHQGACPKCGSNKFVRGVSGRIEHLADQDNSQVITRRPPYRQQVPLHFFPGVGRVMRERLLTEVGTEMEVLHRAPLEKLIEVAGVRIADSIIDARDGKLTYTAGSGGTYGKIGHS